jgi:hypothetical protein
MYTQAAFCMAKIIDFEQMAEYEKFNFDYYDTEKDYLIDAINAKF